MRNLALNPHQHDLRHIHVVCIVEQLLDQLGTAFSHAHCSQRAVTRVAVAAENHRTAFDHCLARILMNDSLIYGNVNSAVLLCRRKTENVVVLVDCAAHRAQTVVAVGHCVGQRKLGKPACTRRLYDADIGYVVRHQRVEFYAQLFVVSLVVSGEYGIRHGSLAGFLGRRQASAAFDDLSVFQINAVFLQSYHFFYLPCVFVDISTLFKASDCK